MDFKLELVALPVSDVDRAKAFYVDQAGFNADHDHQVSDEMRFVQLTPPGSACSIAIGKGLTDAEPGSVRGMQLVVADADAARAELVGPRRGGERGAGVPVGPLRLLRRPGRQRLVGAADPAAAGLGRAARSTEPRRLGERLRRPRRAAWPRGRRAARAGTPGSGRARGRAAGRARAAAPRRPAGARRTSRAARRRSRRWRGRRAPPPRGARRAAATTAGTPRARGARRPT